MTGAGRRVGRAIALSLADAGWSIAVHYRKSRDDAEALVSAIKAKGVAAHAISANLSIEKEVAALIPACERSLGPISCLINNASTFENDTVVTSTRDMWDTHMEVNLRAPFALSQAFYAQLPKNTNGSIINIIDQRVWNLSADFPTYTLSKAGLWALTQILARAMAPAVRVNGVGPGPTMQSIHQSAKDFEEECSAMPLAHQVSTEDICSAVHFILQSSAVTGQMIAVDAGQHMGVR